MLTFAALGVGAIGIHGRTSPLMQVRVVDPDDHELPAGEVGEICCRGPLVMNGYWNRPDETAHRFRNGWHHTNDLGRREVDGSLTFIGPKTRMIKSAAENIYPAEVEGCLKQHPAVADAAVIGVPDPTWTQSVKAIVVLRDGANATADEIIAHCRDHIASYKKPRTRRVRRRAPARRVRGRLRRARRAVRRRRRIPARRAVPTRERVERRAPPFPTSISMPTRTGGGSACVTVAPGVVVSELEDDFHHFVVTLRHDGEQRRVVRERVAPVAVVDVSRRGRCRCAQLAGMPLSRRFTAAGQWTDPKQNCTHQFDTACHAITHAAWGRDDARLRRRGPAARSGHRREPTCASGSTASSGSRGRSTGSGIVDPQPPFDARAVAGRVHALGRRARCPRTTPSRAIVLRRACDIGMGRGMDLDGGPGRRSAARHDGGHLPHDAAERRARRVPPRRLDPRLRPRPGAPAARLSA